MLKLIVFSLFIISSFSVVNAKESTKNSAITVLVSCNPKEGTLGKMTPAEFVTSLNDNFNLGKDGAKIVGVATLPQEIDFTGSTSVYSNKTLTIVKLSDKSLARFIEKRNSEKYKDLEELHSLADLLRELQMDSTGMCDFIIPTRFELMREGFKPKVDLKSKLESCEERYETAVQMQKGFLNDMRRQSKESIFDSLLNSLKSLTGTTAK